MKIIYVADDETIFEDEWECECYEATLNHPNVFNIEFFDADNNVYYMSKSDIFNDETYQHAEKVIIHTDDELSSLLWISDQCGWVEFEQINKCGEWVRHEDEYRNGTWVMRG